MPNNNFRGYEISQRVDGKWNVWAYLPWPDPDLDNTPGAREEYLRRTHGWCAHGWIVVHVAQTRQQAKAFIYKG